MRSRNSDVNSRWKLEWSENPLFLLSEIVHKLEDVDLVGCECDNCADALAHNFQPFNSAYSLSQSPREQT